MTAFVWNRRKYSPKSCGVCGQQEIAACLTSKGKHIDKKEQHAIENWHFYYNGRSFRQIMNLECVKSSVFLGTALICF